MLVKAWSHGAAVTAAFVAIFFVCLVGSWYRPVMRALALLLVVFAVLVARDAMEAL